jgi:dTDP-4-amino-4,6-dideoxygalactose transaminase
MAAEGIGVGVHYPAPVGRLAAFAGVLDSSDPCPRAERLATQILSLPMYPGITVDQQNLVVESLRRALA